MALVVAFCGHYGISRSPVDCCRSVSSSRGSARPIPGPGAAARRSTIAAPPRRGRRREPAQCGDHWQCAGDTGEERS